MKIKIIFKSNYIKELQYEFFCCSQNIRKMNKKNNFYSNEILKDLFYRMK